MTYRNGIEMVQEFKYYTDLVFKEYLDFFLAPLFYLSCLVGIYLYLQRYHLRDKKGLEKVFYRMSLEFLQKDTDTKTFSSCTHKLHNI